MAIQLRAHESEYMTGGLNQASELLDVVDTQDQVLHSATRGEIHRQGLRHRSVHILIFDSDQQLLVQQRSMLKDECPGFWDSSCAGHVDAGEGYSQTAVRELQEELGVTVSIDALKFLFKEVPSKCNGMEYASVFRLDHAGPFVIAADEVTQIEWRSATQLNDEIKTGLRQYTSGFINIWQRYQVQLDQSL